MGVNESTSLQLNYCKDMEFLIDMTRDQESIVAFSNLVELNIERMVSLKGLCYGLLPTRFLQNLKQASNIVRGYNMLHLQGLNIRHCDGLEQVIDFGKEEEIIE
ncbi:hypothetical protein Goari_010428, partial [Gossypium aridum]|nr:hypothetical protein [Gossypium aridum]